MIEIVANTAIISDQQMMTTCTKCNCNFAVQLATLQRNTAPHHTTTSQQLWPN